jgi:hypothetical protein
MRRREFITFLGATSNLATAALAAMSNALRFSQFLAFLPSNSSKPEVVSPHSIASSGVVNTRSRVTFADFRQRKSARRASM